ncbi:MAG: hypothetical protein ACRCYO_04590 [Bacteroidia bacterium]
MKKIIFILALLLTGFVHAQTLENKEVQRELDYMDSVKNVELRKIAMYGFHTYSGTYLDDSVRAVIYFNYDYCQGYLFTLQGIAKFSFHGFYSINEHTWTLNAFNQDNDKIGEMRSSFTPKRMTGFTLMYNADKFDWPAEEKFGTYPQCIFQYNEYSPSGHGFKDPDLLMNITMRVFVFNEKKAPQLASTMNSFMMNRATPFLETRSAYRDSMDVMIQTKKVNEYFAKLYYAGIDSTKDLSEINASGKVHFGHYNASSEVFYAQNDLYSAECRVYWRMDTTLKHDHNDGMVYQISTGKKLELKDLFLPGYEEKLKALAETHKSNSFINDEPFYLSQNFYINGFGLHLLYAQGADGSWHSSCFVPWSELKDFIDPNGPLAFVVR